MYSSSAGSEPRGVLKYTSNANGRLTRANVARAKIMIFPFVSLNGRPFHLTTEQYQEAASAAVAALALFRCVLSMFCTST
jgi:hypothetical protein